MKTLVERDRACLWHPYTQMLTTPAPLPVSPRTLSLRLRALEEEGIVERQTYPEVPPRVEYALTEKGRALVPLIEDMRTYGRRWLGEDCSRSTERSDTLSVAAA